MFYNIFVLYTYIYLYVNIYHIMPCSFSLCYIVRILISLKILKILMLLIDPTIVSPFIFNHAFNIIILKNFLTFIYFWERDRAWVGSGQRERETQNLKQAPGSKLSAQSLTQGSNSWTMRSWPELKSDAQPAEPPRCPLWVFLLTFFFFYSS